MRTELETVLAKVEELSFADIPRFLGELEEIRVTALARLTAPSPASERDELIDVSTAAQRLSVSTDYLYRNHDHLPFTRRMGKRLLFSSLGIERHIKQCRR